MLAGTRCDGDHPCAEGWDRVAERCVAAESETDEPGGGGGRDEGGGGDEDGLCPSANGADGRVIVFYAP